MNQNLGLIGKKLGNTQIFHEDGEVRRVTAITVGPCTVVGKRTIEKDGYTALQLGFGERKEKHVKKAQAGAAAKAGVKVAEVIKEFRVKPEALEKYEIGATISPADLFVAGGFVDVTGNSKGRGFSGVMRRHNFAGAATMTHGSHEYKRHGGSIGTNMTPGRTLPGLKMPGQYGNERTTVQSLRIVKVLAEENIVLVEGGVPGARNGVVTIRHAAKKKLQSA